MLLRLLLIYLFRSNLMSPSRDISYLEKRAKDLLVESKLILTQFSCDKMSLNLHSRGNEFRIFMLYHSNHNDSYKIITKYKYIPVV